MGAVGPDPRGLRQFFTITLLAASLACLGAWAVGVDDLAILAVFTPSLAAAAITRRRSGALNTLWGTGSRAGNAAGPWPLVAALLLFPVLAVVTTLVFEIGGNGIVERSELGSPAPALLAIVAIAVGEEFGWRGFALPRLLATAGPVAASLVLGAAWWAWHIPGHLIGVGTPSGINVVAFAAFVVPVAMIFTAFHLWTGSTTIAIVLHVGVNLANAFTPVLPESVDGDIGPFVLYTALIGAVAVGAGAWAGRRGRPPTGAPPRSESQAGPPPDSDVAPAPAPASISTSVPARAPRRMAGRRSRPGRWLPWAGFAGGLVAVVMLASLTPLRPIATHVVLDRVTLSHFTVEGHEVSMVGAVNGRTHDQLEQLLADHPEVDTLVLTDVTGSIDDSQTFRTARLIRHAGLTTVVPAGGRAESGGVDLFIAGTNRVVEDGGRLGVHEWQGFTSTATDHPVGDPVHDQFIDFYREMLGSPDFYWFTITAAPPDGMHHLGDDEIARFDLVATDAS